MTEYRELVERLKGHCMCDYAPAPPSEPCTICRSTTALTTLMEWVEKLEGAFLDLMADAEDFTIEHDGDVDSNGRMIDCTRYHLVSGAFSFEQACDAFGISPKYGETYGDAIERALDTPARQVLQEKPE